MHVTQQLRDIFLHTWTNQNEANQLKIQVKSICVIKTKQSLLYIIHPSYFPSFIPNKSQPSLHHQPPFAIPRPMELFG